MQFSSLSPALGLVTACGGGVALRAGWVTHAFVIFVGYFFACSPLTAGRVSGLPPTAEQEV